jgi:EpsI family protein
MENVPNDVRRRPRGGGAASALGVCAAFVLCYSDVLRLLIWQWWSNDVYSYAFLIPAISAYLVWTKRQALTAALGSHSYRSGVPTLVFGLVALIVGRAGGFATLQELSILLTLAGVVLICGGVPVAKLIWLPLAYLLFTIPVWDVLTDKLHRPFQLLSARIGEAILGVFQIPAYRAGTVLQLPTVTLEVARACSGVNYLISIVAVAVPYGYLSVSSPIRRTAVVAFAVFVAILSNGLRVAFIGSLQYYGLSAAADLHGPGHVLTGMFVAVVGYVALFIGGWLLAERGRPDAASARSAFPPDSRPADPRLRQSLILVIALLSAAALLRPLSETVPVALGGTDVFPKTVGNWTSAVGDVQKSAVRAVRPDLELSREYRSDEIGTIQLYVGYFAAQKQGRKLIGFGGAELPASATRLSLAALPGKNVDVAEEDVVGPGGGRRYVIAWYDLNGRITANAYFAKLLTVWNSVVYRRSNGAVVAMTLDSSPSVDPERAREALRRFAGGILPASQRYLSAR